LQQLNHGCVWPGKRETEQRLVVELCINKQDAIALIYAFLGHRCRQVDGKCVAPTPPLLPITPMVHCFVGSRCSARFIPGRLITTAPLNLPGRQRGAITTPNGAAEMLLFA